MNPRIRALLQRIIDASNDEESGANPALLIVDWSEEAEEILQEDADAWASVPKQFDESENNE